MIRLLAHQGGWDEALLFVTPLAIAFFAINAFERRGRRHRELTEEGEQQNQSQDPTGDD